MEEITISDDSRDEEASFNGKKSPDRKPSGDDPLSDWLLKSYYTLNKDNM